MLWVIGFYMFSIEFLYASNGEKIIKLSTREYYDSNDAQLFYTSIWGESNIHLGRYDLIESNSQLSKLNNFDKVQQAQLLQEEEMMRTITGFYGDTKIRVLDMGTGYGGFLRNMARRKMLWSGVGVDISGSMIDKTKQTLY